MRGLRPLLALAAAAGVGFVVWNRASDPKERAAARGPSAETAGIADGRGEANPGAVLDAETGAAISGARLTVFRISPDLPEPQRIATVVADDRGRFAFPLSGEGTHVVIEAEGYPPQARWLEEAAEVRLKRGEQKTLRIVDEEGGTAGGTAVDVFAEEGGGLRLGRVDADSHGVVTLVLTGDETLLVRFSGHAYEEVHGSRGFPTELALVREHTIGGRIEDSASNPIPGASVELRQGTGCITDYTYGPTARAGRDGGFLFHGVHGCICELTVKAAGYAERCVGARPGDERMRITLRRFATVSGTVVMPDGSPAAGASVRFGPRDGDEAEADAEGRFELTLEPGPRNIVAYAEEPSARVAIAPAEGDAVKGLRLEIGAESAGSFLRLQVVDEQGRAVHGARVAAHDGSGSTDRDGVAAFDTGAVPGLRTLLAVTPPPEEEGRLIGTLVPAITAARLDAAPVLDIVLHEGLSARIEARGPDGAPLPEASVEVFRDGIESGRDVGNPARRKRDWFVDPHDTYFVRVRAKGFGLFEQRHWSPRASGGVLVATLRPCASVRGRVAGPDGVPLEEVCAAVDFRLDHMGTGKKLRCGPGGSFQIDDLEEGAGTLTLGRERGEPQAGVPIKTVSGQVTDVGTVTLVPPVAHTGKVVDSEGRPLGGACVALACGLPDHHVTAYTRADGTFRIVAPGFGEKFLQVRKGGFGTVRVRLAAEAKGEVTMPLPGAVEIDVEGLDWLVTEYLEIAVLWQGAPEHCRADEFLRWQDDPRPYRITDLAPGRYVVRLTRDEVEIDEDVLVVAGESTKLTFRLR